MYKRDKKVHAQVLEPTMENSFQEPVYRLVHLVRNRDYNFLCGKSRYKIWQDTRKKVTCKKCLQAFEEEKEKQ